MCAATANGLATCPMEGFDERRLCYSLGINTERYSIPLVVSTGYALEDNSGDMEKEFEVKKKARFDLEDMVEFR